MGLDKWNFIHMRPDEFFAGWKGYDRKRKEEWDVRFWISKVNALRTTFYKEQARQVPKDKAPWRSSPKKTKPLPAKTVISMFNMISK